MSYLPIRNWNDRSVLSFSLAPIFLLLRSIQRIARSLRTNFVPPVLHDLGNFTYQGKEWKRVFSFPSAHLRLPSFDLKHLIVIPRRPVFREFIVRALPTFPRIWRSGRILGRVCSVRRRISSLESRRWMEGTAVLRSKTYLRGARLLSREDRSRNCLPSVFSFFVS